MNHLLLPLIAFAAGAAIATQASLNAQLGVLLRSPLLATAVAFFSGLIFTVMACTAIVKNIPSVETLKTIPYYLWFSGGLLGTFGIATFYWLIPKMGIGPMLSYALAGQLILAMLAGNFGWFQLPVVPVSTIKVVGVFSLILGIALITNG